MCIQRDNLGSGCHEIQRHFQCIFRLYKSLILDLLYDTPEYSEYSGVLQAHDFEKLIRGRSLVRDDIHKYHVPVGHPDSEHNYIVDITHINRKKYIHGREDITRGRPGGAQFFSSKS